MPSMKSIPIYFIFAISLVAVSHAGRNQIDTGVDAGGEVMQVASTNVEIQRHEVQKEVVESDAESSRSSMVVTLKSMVYNVEWSNKMSPSNPSTSNAADFIVERMRAGIHFISLPECVGKLLLAVYNYMTSEGLPYTILYNQRGSTGHALIYSNLFTLEASTPCTFDPAESPEVTDLEGTPLHQQIIDRCEAHPLTAEFVLDASTGGPGRPLITAGFASAAGKLLVASVHPGHFTHAVDAQVIVDSISAVTEAMGGTKLPFLLQGDMNTHFGLHTSKTARDELLGMLPPGAHGYGGDDDLTFNLEYMQGLLPTGMRLIDSKPDSTEELVTCCCPPWTPWQFGQQFFGSGCAGTSESSNGTIETDWKDAFATSNAPCSKVREGIDAEKQALTIGKDLGAMGTKETFDAADAALKKGFAGGKQRDFGTLEDVYGTLKAATEADASLSFPFVTQSCLPSTGIIGLHVPEGTSSEAQGMITADWTVPGLDGEMAVFAQYKFDHILVGVPPGYSSTTTQYGVMVPTAPASDHFPLVVELTITIPE